MTLPLAVATAAVMFSTTALAEDWPQWRGTDRTDRSKETGLIQSIPSGGPKLAWTNRDVGLGYSGYVISKGSLYTMGLRNGSEHLIAISVKDGKERWATKVGDRYKNGWGDGPRTTPTVADNQVFAMGGNGDLVAANVSDGKVQWKASMTKLGGKRPNWGYCESVLVDGSMVLCTPGGRNGTMAALNRKNGKLIWQSKNWTDEAQYSSIVPATMYGKKVYVQLTQKSVAGIDAKDGSVAWRSAWQGRTAVIPTPIVQGNEVYIASGYGVGCKKVRVKSDFSVEDVWVNKVMKNHHGGVILHDGHLYGYSDGGGWVCQSWDTGEEVWGEKRQLRKGAIYYADGHFYCLEESSGKVTLIEANTTGWTPKGTFRIAEQTNQRAPKGKIWTHPVVSNGKLYLRDQELLFCYDVKK